MARKSSIGDLNCGMAQALHWFGDRWTLLILRNAFNGMNTFEQLKAHLDVSTSVLSAELTKLVEAGVFQRVRSPEDGRSFQYVLTEKGLELYPVVICLSLWGEKWAPHDDGPRIRLIEKTTGEEIHGAAVIAASGAILSPRDVAIAAGPGADEHVLAYVERGWRRRS